MVEDGDRVVARRGVLDAGDIYCGARRRVLRCILHELCEKMRHVLRLVSCDVDLVERDRNDATVVLDFADSDADYFAQCDRWAVTLWRLCVGENEKALGVTVHPGRKVIDAIQKGKSIRVTLFGFESIDGLELAVDERLVAACEVHERVRDAALKGRDVVSNSGCAFTHGGEARRNTGEVRVLERDWLAGVGQLRNRSATRQSLPESGQVIIGDGEGLIAQCSER